jgi:hypothetical protein
MISVVANAGDAMATATAAVATRKNLKVGFTIKSFYLRRRGLSAKTRKREFRATRPDKTPRLRFQCAKSGTQRTIDDISGAVRIALSCRPPAKKALNLFFPPSTPS